MPVLNDQGTTYKCIVMRAPGYGTKGGIPLSYMPLIEAFKYKKPTKHTPSGDPFRCARDAFVPFTQTGQILA
eukprot:5221431-Pleurochrysis_carterae.AAC.1